MKYLIQKIDLPCEIIELIYSYLDYLNEIKKIDNIWFKRLVTPDFYYFGHDLKIKKYLLKKEEKMLNILIQNKVFDMIKAIHNRNLSI